MGSNETSTILLFSTDKANGITTCHDLRRCRTDARLDNRALIKLTSYNISHGVRYMFNHNNFIEGVRIVFGNHSRAKSQFFFSSSTCRETVSEVQAKHEPCTRLVSDMIIERDFLIFLKSALCLLSQPTPFPGPFHELKI